MLTLGALLQGFRTEFRTEFNDAWLERAKATPDWRIVSSQFASTGERNQYGFFLDRAKVREWIGNRAATSIQAAVYELVNRDWETTLELKANDIKDDMRGMLLANVREIANEFDRAIEEGVFSGLKLGYAATSLCFDGVPFFNATHPRKIGSTLPVWSNYTAAGGVHPWVLMDSKAPLHGMIYQEREAPKFDEILGLDSEYCKTTNRVQYGANARYVVGYGDPSTCYMSCAAITEANLVAAYEAMLAYTDDEGRPLNRVPDTIIFDPTLWAEFAALILKENRWDGTIYTNNLFYNKLKMVQNGWMIP